METENRLKINTQRDLIEISKLIESYMKNTYMKEIESEISLCRKNCLNKPSRERALVEALLPYIPRDKKDMFREILTLLEYEQMLVELLPGREKGYERSLARSEETNIQVMLIKVFLYKMMNNKIMK